MLLGGWGLHDDDILLFYRLPKMATVTLMSGKGAVINNWGVWCLWAHCFRLICRFSLITVNSGARFLSPQDRKQVCIFWMCNSSLTRFPSQLKRWSYVRVPAATPKHSCYNISHIHWIPARLPPATLCNAPCHWRRCKELIKSIDNLSEWMN